MLDGSVLAWQTVGKTPQAIAAWIARADLLLDHDGCLPCQPHPVVRPGEAICKAEAQVRQAPGPSVPLGSSSRTP